MSNVTSDIQNKINTKQPIGNYSSIELLKTLSGTVYTQCTSQSLLNNNTYSTIQ